MKALRLISFFAFLISPISAQETYDYAGCRYLVWKATPDKIKILWKDDQGKALENFPRVTSYLKGKGENPLMLMNGGIFEPGRIPSGLLVQDAKRLRPINRANGKGNFFLKPNGIFYIKNGNAGVVRTSAIKDKGLSFSYAVQSGPLLLEKGKIHPAFNKPSKSRLHRNGVGVDREGKVVFVISDPKAKKWPNLYEFASVFKQLGCEDALFLDGVISQMRTGVGMMKRSNRFASIIAVVK